MTLRKNYFVFQKSRFQIDDIWGTNFEVTKIKPPVLGGFIFLYCPPILSPVDYCLEILKN